MSGRNNTTTGDDDSHAGRKERKSGDNENTPKKQRTFPHWSKRDDVKKNEDC